MTDVLLIAVIVAFFVAAAFVVRLLDGMIAHAGADADPDDEAPGPEPGPQPGHGGPARRASGGTP